MSSPYSAPPRLLGVRLTDVSTTQRHELGSVITGIDGGVYRYIKAGEIIAQYSPVDFVPSTFVASVADADDVIFGVAQVAFAADEYGWILVQGAGTCLVTASLATASRLSNVSAAGAVASVSIVDDADAGNSLYAITYAEEASTPAGVAVFIL